MALIAEHKRVEEMKVETAKSSPNNIVCDGKSEMSKGKRLMAEDEDCHSQDDLDEVDEHLAFLSRRFAKLKFKKNPRAMKPNGNMVEKSKFKCFKCGITGHFANECGSLVLKRKGLSL